jgi:hypothetical protein
MKGVEVKKGVLYSIMTVALMLALILPMAAPVMASEIMATKWRDPDDAPYDAGETIHFVMTIGNPITNTETNTLTNIWDNLPDGSIHYFIEGGVDPPLVQTPGETHTFYLDYVVDYDDMEYDEFLGYWVVRNQFEAEGTDSAQDNVYVLIQINTQVIPLSVGPSIDLEKHVWDGAAWQDADAATGPYLPPTQDRVIFAFEIDNDGIGDLTNVNLVDTDMTTFYIDQACMTPAVFPIPLLADDDPIVTVYGELTFASGQHSNNATVTGTPAVGDPVSDSDLAHYFGLAPSIDLEKQVWDGSTWHDADTPTGPSLTSAQNPVIFRFVITNSGNIDLTNVTLTDTDMSSFYANQNCTVLATFPIAIVPTSAPVTVYGSLPWAQGQHSNTATAIGTPPVGAPVSDADPGHYFGLGTGIETGCTLGFWKNHPDLWHTYDPEQEVADVFVIPVAGVLDELSDDTLMEALNYHGGPKAIGMARNLLGQAVAALLNAADPGVNYAMSVGAIVIAVNDALATLDRHEMEIVKNMLDDYNNAGCSIDASGIESSISAYQYIVDFGDTYSGIAEDFVPPFKVCRAYDFTLTLANTPPARSEGYDEVSLWVQLTDSPFATSEAEITIEGISGAVSANLSRVVPGLSDYLVFDYIAPLEAIATHSYNATLHLKEPGLYEICFVAYYPGDDSSPAATEPVVVAEKCITIECFQWLDAYPIDLYRKWNLISLPLVPFDTDLEAVLAAYPGRDEILSVWYCDASAMLSPSHGPETPSDVSTIEDGKAYSVRTHYDSVYPAGTYHGTLWVFGNAKPLPPAPPLAYPVLVGWNMVGFTSTTSMPLEVYLWNFCHAVGCQFGLAYGFNASSQTWFSIESDGELVPGCGYWIPFAEAGTIYPP